MDENQEGQSRGTGFSLWSTGFSLWLGFGCLLDKKHF
jgi:hypothetical protein